MPSHAKVYRISMEDRFKLLSRLQEVLDHHMNEQTKVKTADYKNGFTDDVIGKEFHIPTNVIGNNRRAVFGNFSEHVRSAIKGGNLQNVQVQIELKELRSRVRYIEQQLGIDNSPTPAIPSQEMEKEMEKASWDIGGQ